MHKMRLRTNHLRWCLGLTFVIIVNVHISLWVRRVYDRSLSNDEHRFYDISAVITANNSSQQANTTVGLLLKISVLENLINRQSETENHQDGDFKQDERILPSQIALKDYQPQLSLLPTFASDETEYLLSSMIERSALSSNLHLTTFLLSHHVLTPEQDAIRGRKVLPAMKETWSRVANNFKKAQYLPSGARIQATFSDQFFCEIKHSSNDSPYTVSGEFLPNRLTTDTRANRLLDVLRCPMKNSRGAYEQFADSNTSVSVNILRGNISLATFTVPWKSRRTGYLMSNSKAASRLDSWKGHELTLKGVNPTARAVDKLHICVTTSNTEPSREKLPLFVEFISHHLLIGASHISLPVPFPWNSPSMNRITEILQSYIQEGKLSIVSQSGDGIDAVRSIGGLSIQEDSIQIMQINMCLHFSRGLAEFVFVTDLNEFFVPRGKYFNFLDLFKSIEPKVDPSAYLGMGNKIVDTWRDKKTSDNAHGWADGHAHPYCYISVDAEYVLNSHVGSYFDRAHPWIGQRFSHGPEVVLRQDLYHAPLRAILPTERVFQASYDAAGACHLPPAWTSCDGARTLDTADSSENGFCNGEGTRSMKRYDTLRTHDFDEVVTVKDSYYLDVQTEGSVLHYLHDKLFMGASVDSLKIVSIYTERYFQTVLEDLRSRGLELMMRIPEQSPSSEFAAEEKWDPLFAPVKIEVPIISLKPVENYFLPNNYSRRSEEHEVELPNFSIDLTEYALGGMIERVSDSYDLYATVFFLSQSLLEPQDISPATMTVQKISPEVSEVWMTAARNFEKTAYAPTGVRMTPPGFYCNISHTPNGPYYIVEGQFVSNKASPDSNANKRLDILRCKMEDTESAYMNLAGSSESMRIEIIRGDFSLMSFRIPWGIRKTGFMLDEPADQVVTKLDPWKGFNKSTPGIWTHDRMHLCVPGWEDTPSKFDLPVLLEWIQHHVLMGASHIFAGVAFGWDSKHMHTINRIVSSFIDDGLVSITSHSGDNIDGTYSIGGLKWARDNVKIFHVNMYTYYSKGVADYVGVWDFDEFFQPRGGNKNLLDLVAAMEPLDGPVKSSFSPYANVTSYSLKPFTPKRGMADGDHHPFCYLIFKSEVTYAAKLAKRNAPTELLAKPWIGQRFAHGHEDVDQREGFLKSIRPTRTTFNGGLHLGGACRLPQEWNGCKNNTDFCTTDTSQPGWKQREAVGRTFFGHRFDDVVLASDAKLIEPGSEGVLNHIQYRRLHIQASNGSVHTDSEYSTSLFPTVYEELEKRGLVMPMELPEKEDKPFPLPDVDWIQFLDLRKKVEDAAAKSLPWSEDHLDSQGLKNVVPPNYASSNSSRSRKLTETNDGPVNLPAFATDGSEMFVASMIERQADSWDLHLTTFLLYRDILNQDDTGQKASRIQPEKDVIINWSKVIVAAYNAAHPPVGKVPKTPEYFCKIKASSGGVSYMVKGELMPNDRSTDTNANKRLVILRCKMENGEDAYMNLARSNEEVTVEIFRETVSLISFMVPWKTRVQSRFLSGPSDRQEDASMGTSKNPRSSIFDPWMGFDRSTPGVWQREKLFMCVPGLESPISRKNSPLYLEFIQHHLLMGASHIFITAAFAWGGTLMTSLQRVLRSFIEDGSISLTSHTDDEIDYQYSIRGLGFHRDNLKIMQVNFCAYFSKGVSDHVAVWDFDEFFIPKGDNKNMLDAIDKAHSKGPLDSRISSRFTELEVPNSEWRGGPGWADGNAHPFCFLQMSSQVIALKPNPEEYPSLWIGDRFHIPPEPKNSKSASTAFKKSIFETKRLWQFGLHTHGACQLEYPWSGCSKNSTGFCYGSTEKEKDSLRSANYNIRTAHSFLDLVRDEDVKKIDPEEQGVLYHLAYFRQGISISADIDLSKKNDYASKFFPQTMEALKKRNLDLMVNIIPIIRKVNTVDEGWIDYKALYKLRNSTVVPHGTQQLSHSMT